MCVYNIQSVHVIVQGFSYRYELCVYNREYVASITSFGFAHAHTHTHTHTHTHMHVCVHAHVFCKGIGAFLSRNMCNNGLHFSRYCIASASACVNAISSHLILWLHMAQSGWYCNDILHHLPLL